MNWNESHTLTPEMAGECYTTEGLIKLFCELQADGYEALSLGLVIDLVRTKARMANTYQVACDDCSTLIDADIHAEEFGRCVDCSWSYWNEAD